MRKDTHPAINGQVLINVFSKLRDPRVRGRCQHRLIDIIFIAIFSICLDFFHTQ